MSCGLASIQTPEITDAGHGLGQREAKIIGELWELVALGSGVLQFHTHLRHCIHRVWWVWAWAILQTKNKTSTVSTATQCPCPSLYCKCASKLLEKPQRWHLFWLAATAGEVLQVAPSQELHWSDSQDHVDLFLPAHPTPRAQDQWALQLSKVEGIMKSLEYIISRLLKETFDSGEWPVYINILKCTV